MSFNPHSVAAMKRIAPDVPRGLVTCAWDGEDARGLSDARRADLVRMAMFDEAGAAFVSHDARDLASAEIARVKARGVPILTWTIRSEEAEREARRVADNVTFEGYLPRLPA
jgi:glycerophosphoryl diester phosphodiesterase